MSESYWKIHKFGGTSVLNAERYRNVKKILLNQQDSSDKAVVVSAMKGVTDDLIEAVRSAVRQDALYQSLLEKIHNRHREAISDLLTPPRREPLLAKVESDFKELADILRGIWLLKEASEGIFARVSGMGEVWSAQILNQYLQQENCRSEWLDAREVLVVKNLQSRVVVEWVESERRLREWRKKYPSNIAVITGFVARTEAGAMTTLGRNGSDYSASIFGSLFSASEIVIWTDVDGVLSADPNQVPEAIVLDEMSYNEIAELAYFGAKVVHPATMAPAVDKQIPILIKNTFKPDFPGTKIHRDAVSNRAVKGFSTIHHMALLNLEGAGLVGVIGAAERLFNALRVAGVNVVLISQASSEQSICVAVSSQQAEMARVALTEAFSLEIQKGFVKSVALEDNVSILAAVGDGMAQTPGVSGRFFTALGRASVNIRAIAQGSSERNISVIIDTKDATRALRTVHSSFILPHQRISIGLIGPGLVGKTFLKQLAERRESLRSGRKVEFQVRAIADSKRMLLAETEIPLDDWRQRFEVEAVALDLEKFALHLRPSHLPHAVMIESTASMQLTSHYKSWLESGIHIISPNKKANSGPYQHYREIRESASKAGRHFLYATNVGAGLPVLQTLRDLCATGDQVLTIMGILSGTLSYIFNNFDGTRPFSQVVLEAKAKGYTEPDPRDDLAGEDVARKLVILAREVGLQIEMKDVKLQGLVSENLKMIPVAEFTSRISELDSEMAEKYREAEAAGEILRFVATLSEKGEASVGLVRLAKQHVFARATGTDNIVLFQTRRYHEQPLVIQGSGAGPEVTAAGVFADLLRLSDYLGSSR